MSIDVSTIVTDYDWAETHRPSLTIASDRKSALLQVGPLASHSVVIESKTPLDLRLQLEGFRDIFAKAVELMADNDSTLAKAMEVLDEVAKPPYSDSDLGSLLETLRHRANCVIAYSKSMKESQ